jgi:hypothetical protein
MKPGDLRRFKNGPYGLDNDGFEGSTVMVRKVDMAGRNRVTHTGDILRDGKREDGLGYHWVEDSSEVISEAG